MKLRIIQTLAVVVFGFALAPPSISDTFLISSGWDVAPYEFLPSSNRGNYTTLYAFDEDNGHGFEAFIRFDLPQNLLPQGHVVTSATFFHTYAFDYTAFGETSTEPGIVIAYEISEDWDANTLTWSNRPLASRPIGQVDNIVDFGPLIYDVTQLAQRWLEGSATNHGIALKSPTARVIGMHSFEASVPDSVKANLLIETAVHAEVPISGPLSLGVLTLLIATVGTMRLKWDA